MSANPDFFASIKDSYQGVPSLACVGCKGECCVSPTMTAAEFVIMMQYLQDHWDEKDWVQILSSPSIEHAHWHGNSYCRFQDRDSGFCIVYPGRAMACRLHGHKALHAYETPESVFCEYEPDQERKLNLELLEQLVDPVREAVPVFGAPYEAPFYFVSLNLECWLDFYFHPEIAKDRPQLEQCWLDLRKHIRIECVSTLIRTTLAGKLNTIEKAFQAMIDGNLQVAHDLFGSLQTDFPSVGTYFITEAQLWQKECADMIQGQQS